MAQKAKQERTNLGFLGVTYQEKLVRAFFEDKKFFEEIIPIVDQNMFTDDALRTIVGGMKDCYHKMNAVPSYQTIDFWIRGRTPDQYKIDLYVARLEQIGTQPLDDLIIVKHEAECFFKQQNLINAVNKISGILRDGQTSRYEEAEDIIRKALEVNMGQRNGERVFEKIEETLDPDYRDTIPTGFDQLDTLMEGGLGKTELGVIIAPSGVGKTSATIGFAASAAIHRCDANNNRGFKVLHYFFEDNQKIVRRKYFAYVTDIEARNLSKPQFRERALEIINDPNNEYRKLINENIIFERLSSGETTVGEIKNKIRGHINRGFIPDLVIIDYFECIKLETPDTRDEKDYNRESRTMRKLESLANELNVALWVPIQGTKGSIGQEFVGMNDGGGSVSKIQIGHTILSFARTPDMANANKMNVSIHKFRGGVGNETLQDITFNNGTCRFYASNATSLDSVIGSNVQQQTIDRRATAMQILNNAMNGG